METKDELWNQKKKGGGERKININKIKQNIFKFKLKK